MMHACPCHQVTTIADVLVKSAKAFREGKLSGVAEVCDLTRKQSVEDEVAEVRAELETQTAAAAQVCSG